MNETGSQTLHLTKLFDDSIILLPGYALGVMYKAPGTTTKKYAKINHVFHGNNSLLALSFTSTDSWEVIDQPSISKTGLQIRFHYSIPVKFNHRVNKSIPGDVRLSIDIKNNGGDPIKKSKVVQFQVSIQIIFSCSTMITIDY